MESPPQIYVHVRGNFKKFMEMEHKRLILLQAVLKFMHICHNMHFHELFEDPSCRLPLEDWKQSMLFPCNCPRWLIFDPTIKLPFIISNEVQAECWQPLAVGNRMLPCVSAQRTQKKCHTEHPNMSLTLWTPRNMRKLTNSVLFLKVPLSQQVQVYLCKYNGQPALSHH